MSSPDLSNKSTTSADLFKDLYEQLGKCHYDAFQELQDKVTKLKKERSLDAQKLEIYYKHNQQLKEQNKVLQDAVNKEERMKENDCKSCAKFEEDLKNSQDQSQSIIKKLKVEVDNLEYENKKLHATLKKLNSQKFQSLSSSDQEEGIIPDSPVLASSLPVSNKLKKRKNFDKSKHVRYLEIPLSLSHKTTFSEQKKELSKVPKKAEVLVPNTCELDTAPLLNEENIVIAETCALELGIPHTKMDTTSVYQVNSKATRMSDVRLKPHRSSSTSLHNPHSSTLLPRVKRGAENATISKAKRMKEEELCMDNKQMNVASISVMARMKAEPDGRYNKDFADQSMKDSSSSKAKSEHGGNLKHTIDCSPEFKKPNRTHLTHKRSETQEVEPMWSIDPALALSMYESQPDKVEMQDHHSDLEDSDCTWISHSVLQKHAGHDADDPDETGIGDKANDSLDRMFDTTECGEYKSFMCSHPDRSPEGGDVHEEYEDGDESPDHSPSFIRDQKDGQPAYAHVAVVRKKDERRKLKGTTCKECEIYYSYLPEEEREKKLAMCSRHRFLHLPPATPENFWEVGFPSTQTCVDRGYIHEDEAPQTRMRRRQPLNALFSQKKRESDVEI